MAVSLELQVEKKSAHSRDIRSVGFNNDGAKIVSACEGGTIIVWDAANPRPYNASEWEEVDISEMEKDDDGEVEIEGLGYISSNYFKNTVTGQLRKEQSDDAVKVLRDVVCAPGEENIRFMKHMGKQLLPEDEMDCYIC